MSLIKRRAVNESTSMKARITLVFFVAMLALLIIMIGIQLNAARSDRQRLHESLLEGLQTTWRTALDSNGVNAARQIPTLLSLAQTGLEDSRTNALISAETRALYRRIDVISADGTILHSSQQPRPMTPLADREFVTTRLRYDRELSELIMFESAKEAEPAILVALRLSHDAYILAARPLAAVAPLLNDGITGHWVVRDKNGKVLSADLPPTITSELLALPASQRGIFDAELNARTYQLIALPLNDIHSNRIATLTSVRDVTDLRRQERYEFFITLSIGFGLIFLTTFLLYSSLDSQFKPLGELSVVVQEIADGDLYSSTKIATSTSELTRMAKAIETLQTNATESDHQRFSSRAQQTANLLLIENEMLRLRETLGSDAQRTLETQLASETAGPERLGRAFHIMVDQVISQQTRLTNLLEERERDLTVVRQALAERTQLTRLREELDIARQLQISNLPGEPAMRAIADRIDLYATMRPAREVGGDFYDFALVDHRYLVLVIGDASGKGVSAAMFGMMARILIKATANGASDPGQCLALANRVLASENNAMLFATAFLAILDISTGQMRYASAGHNPPLIHRKNGGIEVLGQECGLVLGAMEDSNYPTHEGYLAPDDLLVLYTDGVTEAHNASNDLFGEGRLIAVLNQPLPMRARESIDAILESIDQFTEAIPQFDDITLTSIRYRQAG